MPITIKNVRLSYPHLYTPQTAEGSTTAKYSACLLIPKSDEELVRQIKSAINEAIPADCKKGGKLRPGYRIPLRDGDTEREGAEYRGMWFINASSTRKPTTVLKRNGIYTEAKEEELYAGCWVQANVNFFPYAKAGNAGVGVGLNAVCKYRDDEAFAGSNASAEEMFADSPDTQGAAAPAAAGADMPDWM